MRILNFFLLASLVNLTLLADTVNGQESVKPLPISAFVKRSDYLDLQISPDGKHFAARFRTNETVFLAIVNIASGETVGGVKPGDENEVLDARWVSNNRIVYRFAKKRISLDQAVSTGELYAMNIDNTKNVLLAGYRAGDHDPYSRIQHKDNDYSSHRVLNALPEEKKHMLVVEYPWGYCGFYWCFDDSKSPIVSQMHIYSGIKRRSETIPFPSADVYANDKGEVNFVTWVDKESHLRAAYRESKKGEWLDITTLLPDADEISDLSASDINRAGDKVYISGNTGVDKVLTLFEFDLTTKKLSRVFDNTVDLYSWDSNASGEPIIARSYPAEVEYHYSLLQAESPLIKRHKSLRKAFGGQQVSFIDQSDDTSKLMVRVSSGVNPGEYYLYDTDSRKADFLWANYSWIDPRQMQVKRPIQFKARDGLAINGYLTLPASNTVNTQDIEQAVPLIVLPHGGPHGSRDYPFFDYEAQLFASRGYAVLQVNFRGSGGYNHVFEKRGYKNWGKTMIDDIIDGTQWAIDQGIGQANKVCIYGGSYGGYAALMAAAKAPDLYRCTVGYVGVYDLELMLTKGDIPQNFGGPGYLKKAIGTDQAQLIAQSPITHADKIKADVMLIHGDEDSRVPSLHAKNLRKKLKKFRQAR